MSETTDISLEEALRQISYRRNVKGRIEALQQYEHVPGLKKALKYTYDPYIRFGVNISPQVYNHLLSLARMARTPLALSVDSAEVWNTLETLSKTTGSSSAKIMELERLFNRMNYQTAQQVLKILSKSLIKGVAASTVNKAFPGLVGSFGVQLAAKYSDRKIKSFPVYVEPKYDGMRALAVVYRTGEVEFMTRTGRPIVAAKFFDDEVLKIAEAYKAIVEAKGTTYEGLVLDGEVLGNTFNDSVSIFRKDKVAESGTFQIFDMVPLSALSDPSFNSDTYTARREMLSTVVAAVKPGLSKCEVSPSYVAKSKAEIWSIYNQARSAGLEGVIVKNPDGLWQIKRSNDWLKIKAEETLDLPIIGGFEGLGELEGTLGGLIADHEGVQVRVGSGFTRADRDRLYKDLLDDLAEIEKGGTDFKLLGYTVEVQYQEKTKDGSLRHPVFVRLRKDKDEVSF